MSTDIKELNEGSVFKLQPKLLRGVAAFEVGNVESATLVSHGVGFIPWSLIELPNGRKVRVLNSDINPAVVSS